MTDIFETLSEEQKKVVFEKEGLCVVRACPGSGKTYAVSARLIHKLQTWNEKYKGIAVLSFTNVAWKEIYDRVVESTGNPNWLTDPHYLNTIDSFIRQFIVKPFGHLIMKCDVPLKFVGPLNISWDASSGQEWKAYEKYFADVSYDINGKLYPTVNITRFHFKTTEFDNPSSKHIQNLDFVKKKNWKQGYLTQADANYIALRILKEYPDIAKALVSRFPEFIIDEAQDTSEIQMTILDILLEQGNLKNMMLIGDPDQSIFEWNDAKPELFLYKYKKWKENSCKFTENRRSTQSICDVTFKLSSLPEKSSSYYSNNNNTCGTQPEIVGYNNETDLLSIITKFKGILTEHGHAFDDSIILCRSKDLLNTICGYNNPDMGNFSEESKGFWKEFDINLKDLIHGKYLYDQNNIREGITLILSAYIKSSTELKVCSQNDIKRFFDNNEYIITMQNIYKIIKQLPNTQSSLYDWMLAAKPVTTTAHMNIKYNVINRDYSKNLIESIFSESQNHQISNGIQASTVHQAKGKTFDAVLLILKSKPVKAKMYKNLLPDMVEREIKHEELRTVYVAITRPKYYLMIAVPGDDVKVWRNYLLDIFPGGQAPLDLF